MLIINLKKITLIGLRLYFKCKQIRGMDLNSKQNIDSILVLGIRFT